MSVLVYNLLDHLLWASYLGYVVVFFTLTDRASTIPSNTRGCQSGTWSAGQKKDQRNIYQAPMRAKKNTNTQTAIGIGSGNLGTSNPIVLLHGVVFGQIRQAQIQYMCTYFCPRLHRIVFGSQYNSMESRRIVFAVFNLTCMRVPLKVQSYHSVS